MVGLLVIVGLILLGVAISFYLHDRETQRAWANQLKTEVDIARNELGRALAEIDDQVERCRVAANREYTALERTYLETVVRAEENSMEAREMSLDAIQRVGALEKSTHQVQYVPTGDVPTLLSAVRDATTDPILDKQIQNIEEMMKKKGNSQFLEDEI